MPSCGDPHRIVTSMMPYQIKFNVEEIFGTNFDFHPCGLFWGALFISFSKCQVVVTPSGFIIWLSFCGGRKFTKFFPSGGKNLHLELCLERWCQWSDLFQNGQADVLPRWSGEPGRWHWRLGRDWIGRSFVCGCWVFWSFCFGFFTDFVCRVVFFVDGRIFLTGDSFIGTQTFSPLPSAVWADGFDRNRFGCRIGILNQRD